MVLGLKLPQHYSSLLAITRNGCGTSHRLLLFAVQARSRPRQGKRFAIASTKAGIVRRTMRYGESLWFGFQPIPKPKHTRHDEKVKGNRAVKSCAASNVRCPRNVSAAHQPPGRAKLRRTTHNPISGEHQPHDRCPRARILADPNLGTRTRTRPQHQTRHPLPNMAHTPKNRLTTIGASKSVTPTSTVRWLWELSTFRTAQPNGEIDANNTLVSVNSKDNDRNTCLD